MGIPTLGMNQRRTVSILAMSFLFVGVGLLAVAIERALDVHRFAKKALTASGRVINLEHRNGGGRNPSGGYVTVFVFQDGSGVSHTARTFDAQNPPTHRVGEEVVVLYQPDQADDARIKSFRTLWLLPTFLGCLGTAFSGIGGYVLVAARQL